MNKLLVLLCMLVSFPALAAVDTAEEQRLCSVAAAEYGWVPSHDIVLRKYGEEFLRNTDLRVPQVLICTSDDPMAMYAWSYLMNHGFDKIFIIGVSHHFGIAMKEHLRAIIAHEVGHEVVKHVGGACDNFRRTKAREDYVLCEHDTDWVAAQWVGKSAMLRMLEDLARYFVSEGNSGIYLENLKRRIELLEKSR
ncbi:MAG: hypothetical protein Q7S52_04470 [bacterium]|nr:hypothetical protein [bacterium]